MNKRNKGFTVLCLILSVILVNAIVPIIAYATDTNEPNDTSGTATTLTFDRLTAYAISYISTSTDIDWFKVNITHTGQYSCTLTNNNTTTDPYGNLPADFDLDVYDPSLTNIAYSYAGGTTYEKCYFNVSSTGYYYFKIHGYNGAYSSSVPYKLVIQHGDAVMFAEATRFRDYSSQGFYDRLVQSGTGYNDYWHSLGVAYGYGSKDSLSHYMTDIASATSHANSPFNRWDKYNFPTYERPGRMDGDSSTTKNCGIDCSGFVQRCAQAAGTRYKIARDKPLNSGDGLAGNQVAAADFGSWSSTVTAANLETGDIAYWSTHIVMFARINTTDINDCKIIEAAGDTLALGGRVVKESYYSKYSSHPLGRLTQ